MRISPLLVHEFISPDILSTCPHLPASAFSRNQSPRSHFGIWGGPVDSASADTQPEMIPLCKECLLQRVPVIVHICRCLGVNCGSFRGRVAPCCPLFPCAGNKILAWGFLLLLQPCICSWSSGWVCAAAICCGCHSVLVEIRESDGCCCPEVACRRNGIKKEKPPNSLCILESHRLMSCQNVTTSTHTSKGKVKSCQNLTFSQTPWVSSVASTKAPVGAQPECTSKTLGLVKLDWPGKLNPGQLALPCLWIRNVESYL